MPSPDVEHLLVQYHDELHGFIRRHASPSLLKCESVDDLYQGVATRALEAAGTFEARGEAQGRAWLYRVARAMLVDRVRYWTALKRRSTQVIRFDLSRPNAEQSGLFFDPAASQTSPSQFAIRREQLVLAAKALNLLMDRDRDLVSWAASEVPLKEQAARLQISYEAAAQASNRAQERFRKVMTLVQNGS